MDIGLFFIGMLGALLTVYLAKDEVVPEFRPLFDSSEKEKEAMRHGDHISKTEKEIDELQAELRKEKLTLDLKERLTTVLNTSLSELTSERKRLQLLEHEIKQSQVLSRSLGFLFYIVLGGVFGSLLAGQVQVGGVKGLNGDLPNYFKSIVIGATWTSYLSTIGFRSGQKKADKRIEADQKKSAEEINAIKKEISETVLQEVAKAEEADKVKQPVRAGIAAKMVADKLDMAMIKLQNESNLTRRMVQRDLKGFL